MKMQPSASSATSQVLPAPVLSLTYVTTCVGQSGVSRLRLLVSTYVTGFEGAGEQRELGIGADRRQLHSQFKSDLLVERSGAFRGRVLVLLQSSDLGVRGDLRCAENRCLADSGGVPLLKIESVPLLCVPSC